MKSLIVLAAFLVALPGIAQETLPRPQFQPGNTYRYVVASTFEMAIPGKEDAARKVDVQQFARLDALVDGKIKASTERLIFVINMGPKTLKFDSDDPKMVDSKMGKHFSGPLKKNITVTLSPEGKILSAIEGGGGGSLTPLPGLPQLGGPTELKQLIVGLFQGLPPEPVAPGDEWEQRDTRELAEFGDMEFDITYQFLGQQANAIGETPGQVIEYVGGMRGDVAMENAQSGKPSKSRLGFDGSNLKGKIVFDPGSRTILQSEQNVDMTVSVPNPQTGGDLQLPVKQTSLIRLTGFEATK